MRNKSLLTLLLLPALCMAQFAPESPCFNPDEISNLYQIGKGYEWYKKEYPKRLNDIDSLAGLVYKADERLNGYMYRDSLRYVELVKLYDIKEKAAVQIEASKHKGWTWWEWALFGLGSLTSGWIGYQIGK